MYAAAAAGCKDKVKKRQLLLHSAAPEAQDIFETLSDTGDDFDTASRKFTSEY